jgi:hypothetical protein
MNYTTNDTDKTVLKKLYHEIEISYKRRNMIRKVWIGREINHQLLLELENDLCRSSCQQKAGCLLAGLCTIFCLLIYVLYPAYLPVYLACWPMNYSIYCLPAYVL